MPLIHLTHEYNQLGTKLEIFTKNMFRDFEFLKKKIKKIKKMPLIH